MNSGQFEDWLLRRLRFNPCIAVQDIRIRMRGAQLWRAIFYCTLAAIVVVGIALGVMGGWSWGSGFASPRQVNMGRSAFTVLAYTELTLIVFILPAYAATAITMEWEKGRPELWRITLLSARDVVTGKLVVMMAFAGILLITSLPVAAWCVPLGGVAFSEIFFVYTFLGAVATWVASLGLFLSACAKKAVVAVACTYLVMVFWFVQWPYIALAFVVGGEGWFSGPGTPPIIAGAGQVLIWLTATVAFLLMALVMWLLSVLAFRSTARFAR